MKISNSIFLILSTLISLCGCNNTNTRSNTSDTIKIKIILGSTREERSSDKVAHYIDKLLSKRTDAETEIVDLRDYKLDFLSDKTPPASRKVITDPCIKRWSETITDADAFIIVVPEYNAGYPGVLKNALDSLYKEWNGKPVGFVGYSGGPSGGTSAVAQLRAVTSALKMVPVSTQINIPTVWKAFDSTGNLIDHTVAALLDTMVNQLIKARS
jgi:NAD(P)H-dependent FMN reductase